MVFSKILDYSYETEREALERGQRTAYMQSVRQSAAARRRYEDATKVNAQPILDELKRLGLDLRSVDGFDYRNMSIDSYAPIFDVLLRHFYGQYMFQVRANMAQAMGAPHARELVWPHLMQFYKNEQEPIVRGHLADAIKNTFVPQKLEEVIALLEDPRMGPSRLIFTGILARSRQPRALEVLHALKDEPDLHLEIAHILKQKARYAEKKAEKDAAK